MNYDDNDLTEEQTAELRDDLQELQTELQGALNAQAESARPVDLDQPIGRLSRMDEMQRQQMARSQQRRQKGILSLTKAALDRLRKGAYGICLECEMPIGFPRLKAQPYAALCRQCQGAREL